MEPLVVGKSHKTFLIAETMTSEWGMRQALGYLGAPDWSTDARTDSELLTEFAGRLCYKSFKPGLNPNVTKVREGNPAYLENIMKQAHGSVFEHASTSLLFCNVSRIFTHELVRHRAGVGISQESQRFVRLDEFQMYIPDLTDALQELADKFEIPSAGILSEEDKIQWVNEMQDNFVYMAEKIRGDSAGEISSFLKMIGLDREGVPFHVKKTLTSALRRLLPGGVNTNILVTANHRAWRHILTMRAVPGAEQEIAGIMYDVGFMFKERYPALYQDMKEDTSQGGFLTFEHVKI